MALEFSIPPNFVEDSTCASFSYGKGPISRCITSTISVARRNGTESANAESSGYVQTSIGIVSRPLITGRRLLTVNSPAPITMVYAVVGNPRVDHDHRPCGGCES